MHPFYCTPQGERLMGTGYFIKPFTSLLRIWGCNCVCFSLLLCVTGRRKGACRLEREGSTTKSHEWKNTIQKRQTSEENMMKIMHEKKSFLKTWISFIYHELTLCNTDQSTKHWTYQQHAVHTFLNVSRNYIWKCHKHYYIYFFFHHCLFNIKMIHAVPDNNTNTPH